MCKGISDLIDAELRKERKRCGERVRQDFKATEGHSDTIDRVCAAIIRDEEE
jgi:hypothetical protein